MKPTKPSHFENQIMQHHPPTSHKFPLSYNSVRLQTMRLLKLSYNASMHISLPIFMPISTNYSEKKTDKKKYREFLWTSISKHLYKRFILQTRIFLQEQHSHFKINLKDYASPPHLLIKATNHSECARDSSSRLLNLLQITTNTSSNIIKNFWKKKLRKTEHHQPSITNIWEKKRT